MNVWDYVALEAEIPNAGDFKTTAIGERPVIVARDRAGGIGVFENRCAHRGVAFCYVGHGTAKAFQCPYHQWTYDLQGNLIGIPFRKGINGQGGMPGDFDVREHPLSKLHVGTRHGVVFASYDPPREVAASLGSALPAFDRIFDGRPLRVLGYWRRSVGERGRALEQICRAGDQVQPIGANAILQQRLEALVVHHLVPAESGACEVQSTVFGYASDDDATTRRRLRDAELVGPSAFAS